MPQHQQHRNRIAHCPANCYLQNKDNRGLMWHVFFLFVSALSLYVREKGGGANGDNDSTPSLPPQGNCFQVRGQQRWWWQPWRLQGHPGQTTMPSAAGGSDKWHVFPLLEVEATINKWLEWMNEDMALTSTNVDAQCRGRRRGKWRPQQLWNHQHQQQTTINLKGG